MRIRDNIVRMYSMMTGQTQEQITIVSNVVAFWTSRPVVGLPSCLFLLVCSDTSCLYHHSADPPSCPQGMRNGIITREKMEYGTLDVPMTHQVSPVSGPCMELPTPAQPLPLRGSAGCLPPVKHVTEYLP